MQILLYDLRSSAPIHSKDHMYVFLFVGNLCWLFKLRTVKLALALNELNVKFECFFKANQSCKDPLDLL